MKRPSERKAFFCSEQFGDGLIGRNAGEWETFDAIDFFKLVDVPLASLNSTRVAIAFGFRMVYTRQRIEAKKGDAENFPLRFFAFVEIPAPTI